ncbi:class D sortase [Anaerobacillus alkaliphilus]|uniref:Class D sortase n=1 Tax=Anaerobacillus alkaliphilus TaxID=1548597 RepID=A0A4Q0VWG8_9BACI|nr:class D sortase [Anaerobacillus alkaliphilus]RXJ02926.1 class D sortase [Anaerobacillus alkaliphilus]
MKKFMAIFLISVGIITIFYPKIADQYSYYQKNKLIKEFRSSNAAVASFSEVNRLLEIKYDEDMPEVEEEVNPEIIGSSVIGMIEIGKIDLLLPILYGATEANLKFGAGFLEGTAPLGGTGNTAVAAHRSHAFGKLFNRLDELTTGDQIAIYTNQEMTNYIVQDIKLVLPSDISVLEDTGHDIITLITCHPMTNPTHRLIVHAKRIEEGA